MPTSTESLDKAGEPTLRLLTRMDLPEAFRLSSLEGWNQTVADWHLLLAMSPENCFCVEKEGAVVATTTLVPYEDRLGWIGMVLTDPSCRRRGLAERLLRHVLGRAAVLGIKTLKLDATQQGRPLYSKLGFVAEQTIERWVRPGNGSVPRVGLSCDREWIATWAEHDRAAFGADRSLVLKALLGQSRIFCNESAYLFTRAGRTSAYLGPCVSRDLQSARDLLGAITASHNTSWSWDVLSGNANAMRLASEMGFSSQRCLLRMRRGRPTSEKDEQVYAIAGFEFG